jgi:hypothetical protein
MDADDSWLGHGNRISGGQSQRAFPCSMRRVEIRTCNYLRAGKAHSHDINWHQLYAFWIGFGLLGSCLRTDIVLVGKIADTESYSVRLLLTYEIRVHALNYEHANKKMKMR